MSDFDFAFNSYCIACDKLCPANALYCSSQCKECDEQQSHMINDQQHQHQHNEGTQIVSPLLTPVLYQHYTPNYATSSEDINASPLLLLEQPDSSDVKEFDLNYSVAQYLNTNSNSSNTTNLTDHLPSTSHNYRKWLTACL